MASIFDPERLIYGGHGVAESTLMLATMSGGHFYNMKSDTDDIDNGSVVKVPNPELWNVKDTGADDVFDVEKCAIGDKVCLVLTAPKIYPEYTIRMQEEGNFFNAAGEIMRVYEVYETDRFSLSDEAFDEDAEPEKGKWVCVKAGSYKLTTADDEPDDATYGFIGYILKQNVNGTWDIFVKKNQQLATSEEP